MVTEDETKVKFSTSQVIYKEENYTKIKEGQAEILFPDSNKVFYNPVQEFNRDLSVSILRQFSKIYKKGCNNDKKESKRQAYIQTLNSDVAYGSSEPSEECQLSILEALSATGLRAIRYVKEVPAVHRVLANDLSKQAVESIRRNIEYNEAGDKITASHSDATSLLCQHRDPGLQFDVVDLDPYGSPHIFLEGAVQAVAEGGLLMVTCTDMAVLCGNSPEKCYANYGATSIRTKSCHEMALRIVLKSVESHANRYGRYIVPLLSVSADFYVRLAVRVFTSPLKVKESFAKVGWVWGCSACDTQLHQRQGVVEREGKSVRYKLATQPPGLDRCAQCESRLEMAGPVWLEPLHDPSFVAGMLDGLITEPELGTQRRMHGMLTMIQEEVPDAPLYFIQDKMCGVVGTRPVKLTVFMSALLNAGYRVSQSHCAKGSLKTDAPASVVWDVVRAIEKQYPISAARRERDRVAQAVLGRESKIVVDFSPHPAAQPMSRERALLRFQRNPLPNWGPQSRASTSILPGQDKRARNQGKNKANPEHSHETEAPNSPDDPTSADEINPEEDVNIQSKKPRLENVDNKLIE